MHLNTSSRGKASRACLLLALVCAVLLQPSEAHGKTRLRLWNYWPPDVRDPGLAIHREVFLRFVEQHPELEIIAARSLTFLGGSAETGRFMAMASGTAPDVIAELSMHLQEKATGLDVSPPIATIITTRKQVDG